MTLKLARDLPEKPFNTTLQRFHSKYWTVDYNALMVGTILQIDERGFKIPAQWRTNSDFVGVKWISEDTYDHEYFRYSTDNNYRDTILAFRANPSEPHKFTATIASGDVPLTYRLVPYVLDPATNRYTPLDLNYNTGRTYPASVMRPRSQWTAIPNREVTPYRGRRDYIYILDFSDLRMFSRFDGPRIPPEDISSISFDTVEKSHGLGRDAMVQSMVQVGNRVRVKITGATPGAVLSKGDRLSVLGKFRTKTVTTIAGGFHLNQKGRLGWFASSPYTRPPMRVEFRPLTSTGRLFYMNVWDGSASKTVDVIFKAGIFRPMAPADDVVKPTVTLQGRTTYYGPGSPDDGPVEHWILPWLTDVLPVTEIVQLSYSSSSAQMLVTFDTAGSKFTREWAWGYRNANGSWGEDYIDWINLTYPCYEITSQEMQFEVDEWSGFGTGELTVWYVGKLPGDFIECETFYSRYLQVAAPVEVLNSTKYFVDMTCTGARTTLRQKHYPQPEHSLMMTSGFDDGYNLTPARQVDMVHALGYRGFWTKYLGMSHYFNGRTAWQDKETGEIIPVGQTLDVAVMFAGDHSASAHFVQSMRPDRGQDAFQAKAAEIFGVAAGQVVPLNGATGSSAADRAAAFDPNDPVYDQEAGLPGGLWWWDLEADAPGPALLNCINRANATRQPVGVVWACGQQDYQATASPGSRYPVPTVARTIEATRKVFAYMRQQWGAELPIVLQGIGWSWPAEALESDIGQPMYLSCTRNSWGDVVFTWLAYKQDPAELVYELNIYHPNDPDTVLVSYDAPGSSVHGGLITFDWPVEENVKWAVAAFGDQFPWGYLKWRVRLKTSNVDGEALELMTTLEANVEIDNNAFVKKVCVLGINSLIGGYFNDLSDTLNPGGTGRPGRKDVVAASTFRRALAQSAGLRDVEVLPVMTVVGSSPINPMPYQVGFPADNYWWNPDTNEPGPNLLLADAIVKGLGRVPDVFVESGPGETTGIAFAAESARPAILAAWRTSNIAMLAWMRANWGNTALEIWFQGATTSFWGAPPPTETNAQGAQLLRDLQTSMSKEGIGFKMGSYVPNANLYSSYRNEMAEGLGWVHYTEFVYHGAAAEMGQAIGLNFNRAYSEPVWAQLRQPKDLIALQALDDIRFQWSARPGFDTFYYRNLRGDTGAVISQGVITATELIFTAAEQIAAYGALATYVVFEVSEYMSGTPGPSSQYAGAPAASADLLPVTNLLATKQLNKDITLTWDVRTGFDTFYYRNLRADNSAVISEGVITGGQYLFDQAAQVAEYGFDVLYTHFQVAEYDADEGLSGPVAVWNGDAQSPISPLNPVTGFSAVFTGTPGFSDVNMSWNASPAPGRKFRVINRRVDTLAVITDQVIPTTAFAFTAAQQIAEYGYTVGYIAVDVMEHDDAANLDGPVYSFNGAPS